MGSRKERVSKSKKTRKSTKLVNSKKECFQENVDCEEQEVWWKNTVVGVLAHPAIMNSKNENKPRD